MKVLSYKTKKVEVGDKLFPILDDSLPKLQEKDIIIITSKILAIIQGRVIKNDGKLSKFDLLQREADLYLPDEYVNYGINITIKNNILIASAGIDESNGHGYFILWPENLKNETNKIWKHLKDKNQIKELGVIIADSHLMPMRKGITGFALSWAGFEPLRNYIGKPDIYGKDLMVTKASNIDGLSAAAVQVMGEGNEQTPLAVISDASNIKFLNRVPTNEEVKEMSIEIGEDVYSGILKSVKWTSGKK